MRRELRGGGRLFRVGESRSVAVALASGRVLSIPDQRTGAAGRQVGRLSRLDAHAARGALSVGGRAQGGGVSAPARSPETSRSAPRGGCAVPAERKRGQLIAAKRPARWLRDIERATRDYRHAKADALRDRAAELATEAAAVLAAVSDAERTRERQWSDLGRMWDALTQEDHASLGDSDVARIVLRWDRELATRAEVRRRTGRPRQRPAHPDDETPERLLPEDGQLADLFEFARKVMARETKASQRRAETLGHDDPLTPSDAEHSNQQGFEFWLECISREAGRRLASCWHSDRAAAVETTFERANTCNTEPRGTVRCECGHGIEVRKECGNHWVCDRCRGKRKTRYRKKFRAARAATLADLQRAKLAFGQGSRAFFAERFLTLTMPRAHGTEQGCKVIRDAWRLFWKRVRAALVRHYAGHLSKRAQREYKALIRCVRVIEVAEGSDGTGHVHIHAWFVAPFIRAEVLRAMWGTALLASGFPAELAPMTPKTDVLLSLKGCSWSRKALRRFGSLNRETGERELFYPRLDIRLVRRGKSRVNRRTFKKKDGTEYSYGSSQGTLSDADICEEIIKYITKDLGSDGRPLDAALWAAIYRGLAGARIITATHGFWVAVMQEECPCCGQTDWRIELLPKPKPRATSPPLLRLIGGGRGKR